MTLLPGKFHNTFSRAWEQLIILRNLFEFCLNVKWMHQKLYFVHFCGYIFFTFWIFTVPSLLPVQITLGHFQIQRPSSTALSIKLYYNILYFNLFSFIIFYSLLLPFIILSFIILRQLLLWHTHVKFNNLNPLSLVSHSIDTMVGFDLILFSSHYFNFNNC